MEFPWRLPINNAGKQEQWPSKGYHAIHSHYIYIYVYFLFFSMGSSLSNATNSSSVLSYSISHGWSYDPVDGCEITSCKHHGAKHPMVKKNVLKIGCLVVWNRFCSLFSIQLGINRSQLTNSIIFQRGRLNHHPVGFQHVSTILFGGAGFRNPPVWWSVQRSQAVLIAAVEELVSCSDRYRWDWLGYYDDFLVGIYG